MNNLLFNTLYIIIDLFGTYILLCYLRLFNGNIVKNYSIEKCSYILVHIISYIISIVIGVPIILSIFNAISLFLLTYNYISSIKRKILSIAITMIINLIVEYIMIIIFERPMDIVVIDFRISLYIKISLLGMGILLSKFFDSTLKSQKSYIQWYLPIFFSIIMIIIDLLIQQLFFDKIQIILTISLMFSMIISLGYIHRLDQERLKTENKLFRQRNDNYVRLYKKTHDYSQKFNSIRHIIKDDFVKINGILSAKHMRDNEIEELMDEVLMATIDIDETPIMTDNIDIDSVLDARISESEEKGIEVVRDILIPEQMDVDKDIISMILNSIFDAAIEEVGRIEIKIMNFIMRYDAEYVYIFLIHPYDDTKANRKKELFNKHKDMIKEIRSEIKPYHGRMYCDIDDEKVVWDVFMYAGEL